MPLNKSKSEGAFHENVAEMIRAGHPQKQALAAAYRVMRGYDDGGTVDPVVLPQNPNPLADNPFSHYVAQKLYGLGQGVVDAATLPGDVYAGRTDPTSDEGEERTFNLAQMMTGTPRGGSLGSGIILPKGIRAYHGSPYDFDRFDMSKIGTGEGAQSYGHGLYFAENPEVADMYSRVVTKSQPGWQRVTPPAFDAIPPVELAKIPDDLRGRIAASWQNNGEEVARNLARKAFEENRGTPYSDALHALANTEWNPSGHRYEVNINAHPDEFLDWDKPLTEQHAAVQRLIRNNSETSELLPGDVKVMDALQKDRRWNGGWDEDRVWRHIRDTFPNAPEGVMQQVADRLQQQIMLGTIPETFSGNRIHQALVKKFNAEKTTQMMSKEGIPGIKYLDQGSRGAGEGSHNFVVFNDKLIDILRKYGLAGLTAGAGATAATGQNDMKYASGGNVLPFYARSEARNLEHSGFIHSPVPGRTDRLPMGVKGGSYVLPADTVSAVGQGNSLAGAHALTRLFGMGPYGSSMPHISGGRPSIPKLPSVKPPKFARGGPVDIVAAGGEMVIPPHVVAQIGKGDMKLGHDILDAFVKHTRAKTVKKLKSLPDPKKK